ncbi:ATPase AAA [Halorubrum sp. AJ67]|nr:ATPase AAA [Halorubrum sp. AJ67]
MPEPDREARHKILDVHTREKPLVDGIDLDRLADETEGYSGAEIAALSRAAAMRAIERVADEHGEAANDHADEVGITEADFDAALESVRPETA